jgi:pimeloyl-ACP methyl ester carboxylesterase
MGQMMRALLVHGLSSDAGSWWWLREQLKSDGWDVTAVDLRGHGSAPRPGRYRIADYASDLAGVRADGTDDWDLVVGHSLGGAASVVAARRAGFTRRLALLDPVLEVPEQLAAEVLAAQLDELALTPERLAAEKPHWHELDREAKLRGIRSTDAFVVEHTFTDTGRWDVRAEASALTVPTLVLAGDPAVYSMVETETLDALAAANPLVEVHVVAGAGHSPHRDRPAQTIAALRDWLLRH